MGYDCQLIFTRLMCFTNMFRFDLLWPVGVPNASDFLKCRASSNPSHPARLLHILVIIPQYASKGYHEVKLCLPGALQYCWSYCQNGPPSKMWSPRSRLVQCGRGDTSFLSFDHWYSPWSNRSIISAKSMISYTSCHQEFPGYVNYILNKLISDLIFVIFSPHRFSPHRFFFT